MACFRGCQGNGSSPSTTKDVVMYDFFSSESPKPVIAVFETNTTSPPETIVFDVFSSTSQNPTVAESTQEPAVTYPPRNNSTGEAIDLARLRNLSAEDKKEEKRNGVSTELTLFTDPWKIKKRMTVSDLNQLSRLLLKTDLVQEHILRHLSEDEVGMVTERGGLEVNVRDNDTGFMHRLVLKRWMGNRSYILNGGWSENFVRRRQLNEQDEIGLFWDPIASILHFRVLARAPHNPN